jgi:hypothetical protein
MGIVNQMEAGQTHIRLSDDEALVLFELLSQWTSDAPQATAHGNAECAVLHGILASLEAQITAPFSADYDDQLAAARGRLSDCWEAPNPRAE